MRAQAEHPGARIAENAPVIPINQVGEVPYEELGLDVMPGCPKIVADHRVEYREGGSIKSYIIHIAAAENR